MDSSLAVAFFDQSAPLTYMLIKYVIVTLLISDPSRRHTHCPTNARNLGDGKSTRNNSPVKDPLSPRFSFYLAEDLSIVNRVRIEHLREALSILNCVCIEHLWLKLGSRALSQYTVLLYLVGCHSVLATPAGGTSERKSFAYTAAIRLPVFVLVRVCIVADASDDEARKHIHQPSCFHFKAKDTAKVLASCISV